MSFWTSGCGQLPTGDPQLAFIKEFTTIPNNTSALSKIMSFVKVEKDNAYTGVRDKYLLITWKIESGDFKGQEVTQKIKCFDGKPEQIDRSLNMLKLVMDLCGFKPTHSNEPTDDDLSKMHGNVCGIKIREWSMPKKDGSGVAEGNFVSEVWAPAGFQVETGVKIEHVSSSPVDSALSRHSASRAGVESIDDDLPF